MFDHLLSETVRNVVRADNHIIDPDAPSAALVVYDYYGGAERFPTSWEGMMEAIDKGDAAQFNREEILHPSGWPLLNLLMDARTGLGQFHEFRISNYHLMMELIEKYRTLSIDEIIALPDVQERVTLFFQTRNQSKRANHSLHEGL